MKLVHLVGLTIRIYYDARTYERQIYTNYLFFTARNKFPAQQDTVYLSSVHRASAAFYRSSYLWLIYNCNDRADTTLPNDVKIFWKA